MNAIRLLDLQNAPDKVADSSEGAVGRLLELTDHAKIEKWMQFPTALFVFLLVPGDPESGAFYVYDRCARIWYWLDFDDQKYSGYTISDFDQLVRECRFLDLVEQPRLLAGKEPWFVTAGSRPQRIRPTASTAIAEPA
ncbi:MAG TPA: hypothetical protein VJ731_00505 [Terriglobales bacterium]|nr:hypothetical protein [Terriglobales bacterium]